MMLNVIQKGLVVGSLVWMYQTANAGEALKGTSLSGAQLIAAVKAARPKGDLQIRATLKQKDKPLVQVQIKRHTASNGDELHLYQILFPKDRKGEGLALRVKNGAFSGWCYTPGTKPTPLKPADRAKGLFGTDVLIEDLLADFLDWPTHQIVGNEILGKAQCSIVATEAPSGAESIVRSVKCWIENERMFPKKIMLQDGKGRTVRTVATDQVMRSSSGYFVPTEFSVHNLITGSTTDVSGRGLRDDLKFADEDFSDSALTRSLRVGSDN